MKRTHLAGLFALTVSGFIIATSLRMKISALPDVKIQTSDLYQYYLPLFSFAKRNLLAGSIPFWNPHQMVGTPFFTTNSYGLLYPPNWLILLFDLPEAILAIQIMAVVIGMLGTFLYSRYLKLQLPGIVVATVLFGYSIMRSSCPGNEAFNLTMGSSYCWFPFILLSAQRLFDRPALGPSLALTASLVLSFLAGHQQFFFYNCVLVSIYFIFLIAFTLSQSSFKNTSRRVLLFGVAFVFMVGLVSVQLLPTFELSLLSARNPTQQLYAAGDPFSKQFSAAGTTLNFFNYFGSSVLLIPFAFVSRRHRPIVFALLAALAYAFLFVLSNNVPCLSIFGRILFASSFRVQQRIIHSAYPLFALLAGIGLSSFWERGPIKIRNGNPRKIQWFWGVLIVYLSAVLHPVIILSVRLVYRSPGYLVMLLPGSLVLLVYLLCSRKHKADRRKLLIVPGVLLVAIGIIYHYDIFISVVYYSLLLAGILVSLLLLGDASRYSANTKLLYLYILAALVLADSSTTRYARWTVPAEIKTHYKELQDDPMLKWIQNNEIYDRMLLPLNKDTNPNIASMKEFYNLSGAEPFTLARWENYVRDVTGKKKFTEIHTSDNRFPFMGGLEYFSDVFLGQAKLAGLTSLKYILTQEFLGEEIREGTQCNWRLRYHGKTEPEFFVYENVYSLPRSYVVNHYSIAQNEQESLRMMRENIESLGCSVIIENGDPTFPPAEKLESPGEAQIKKYGINEVELRVETNEPSLVILTDSYYPGWRAYIDGIEQPIWRANSLFRAVEVPRGTHTLYFRYEPASFRLGLAISIVSAFVVILVVFFGKAGVFKWLPRTFPRCNQT